MPAPGNAEEIAPFGEKGGGATRPRSRGIEDYFFAVRVSGPATGSVGFHSVGSVLRTR
jgi:hypothetical protein